jgi:hypothetical protein
MIMAPIPTPSTSPTSKSQPPLTLTLNPVPQAVQVSTKEDPTKAVVQLRQPDVLQSPLRRQTRKKRAMNRFIPPICFPYILIISPDGFSGTEIS